MPIHTDTEKRGRSTCSITSFAYKCLKCTFTSTMDEMEKRADTILWVGGILHILFFADFNCFTNCLFKPIIFFKAFRSKFFMKLCTRSSFFSCRNFSNVVH